MKNLTKEIILETLHKNRKLMVQDIDGTHDSLTGNSRLINM